MTDYITAIMIGIFQIILSVSLIVRKKNGIAIVSEILSSIVLLVILSIISIKLQILELLLITLEEYLFVKIFLVFFMLIARYYSFYKIRALCAQKKKVKSSKLKFVRTINTAEYWPKLKLGIPAKANKIDTKTRVRFDSKGFPIFKAYYTVKLERKEYKLSRERHFYIANKRLYKDKSFNAKIKTKFSRKQIKQLAQGQTPDGYTWHHHQDVGKLQLVEEVIHAKTWHHGGYSIWGGK